MNPQQFTKLAAQGFNRIPIVRKIIADLETPLSIYMKLANMPYSYLFESMQGGEKWGRYSIIGLSCSTRIIVHGYQITLETKDRIEHIDVTDPLAWIANFQKQFKVATVENLPRFSGGLVGYFAYDTIRYIEPRLATSPNPDPLDAPDILLMLSDEVLVFDNLAGCLYIIINADPSNSSLSGCEQRIQELIQTIQRPISLPTKSPPSIISETDFISEFSETGYKDAVKRIKNYITAGDCMQVVLSQRLAIPFTIPAIDLYRALRILNPSPYM
ncbi:anthranilate synthase component I, partial [Achromatium sp. WMS3]